jgi:hypothetical protein
MDKLMNTMKKVPEMNKDQRKALGAILLAVISISLLITGVEIAKLMVQSYQKSGMTGIFAVIGLLFTMYVAIFWVQKGHRWIMKRYVNK